MSQRRVGWVRVAACALVAVQLAACSETKRAPAAAEAAVTASSPPATSLTPIISATPGPPYAGPSTWTFPATGLVAGDHLLGGEVGVTPPVVVSGAVAATTGPGGTTAGQFTRSGRLVTPITRGLSSKDAFTLELQLRADGCAQSWGRVLGTTALTAVGREGVELLHYPQRARVSACHFGVEVWHEGVDVGGCSPSAVPVIGRWVRWDVVYSQGRMRCYLDGQQFSSSRLSAPRVFGQPGPLGIGGSGSGFQGSLEAASIGKVSYRHRAAGKAEVAAGLSKR